MKIDKEKHLEILWYEDEGGNVIPSYEDFCEPKGAVYQVTRFPKSLTTTYLKLINQEDVDKCRHPRKHITNTYGWVDGVVGRECKLCYGTQTKKKWHLWPKKWNGCGAKNVFEGQSTWNDEETVLAMANSGDYTLSEAIIIYASSCERCINVLAFTYTNGKNGYAEYSEEWHKCGTSCEFCKQEELK